MSPNGSRPSAAFRCRSRLFRSALPQRSAPSAKHLRKPAIPGKWCSGRATTVTFLSPMAATGLSTPIWREKLMLVFSGEGLPRYPALSSTDCSSVLPARLSWQALREFALLNGGNPAIEENWNEASFKHFVGHGPCSRSGPDRRSGRRTAEAAGAATVGGAAQAGLARRDRRGQGDPGDEERQRDVCQRHSQSGRSDQERAAAEQPELSNGPQRAPRARRRDAA